jgi:hypothetical protein
MMKIKTIILVATSILFLNAESVHSASTESTLKAHAGVAQIFKVSFEKSDLDFGSLKAGTRLYNLPKGGFKINCKSNVGGAWTLKVSSDGFSDGSKIIALENTRWYGLNTNGKGTLSNNQINFSQTPITLYQSSETEANNLPIGTDIDLRFAIDIPFEQQPGDYTARIQFTLTQ